MSYLSNIFEITQKKKRVLFIFCIFLSIVLFLSTYKMLNSKAGSTIPSILDNTNTTTWLFSDDEFNVHSKLTDQITINSMTIFATANKPVNIANVNQTIENETFSKCLKLNGMGKNDYRIIELPVTPNTTVEIVSKSNSILSSRYLLVKDVDGNIITEIKSTASGVRSTFEYTGQSSSLYIMSKNSGINIYRISTVPTDLIDDSNKTDSDNNTVIPDNSNTDNNVTDSNADITNNDNNNNITDNNTTNNNSNIDTNNTNNPKTTIDDLPSKYQYALDWIWNNRITYENSTARRNLLFDQLIDGKGTLNYVVRWQSYKSITLQQRQNLEVQLEKALNEWTDCLIGYENWPLEHIDVKIVGWAVLDKSCLLDLQPDEIVYDNLISSYDSSADTSNGREEIPNVLPSAPDNISRFYHFVNNTGFNYTGGLDKRFDMYLWVTQGFPYMAGCGGDWGQRFSDDVYLAMANDGTGLSVQQHELGHAFGMPDYYGPEGSNSGYPPGGFPEEGTVMWYASEITEFDAWQLRYIWTKIKDETGRFNLD